MNGEADEGGIGLDNRDSVNNGSPIQLLLRVPFVLLRVPCLLLRVPFLFRIPFLPLYHLNFLHFHLHRVLHLGEVSRFPGRQIFRRCFRLRPHPSYFSGGFTCDHSGFFHYSTSPVFFRLRIDSIQHY